MLRNANKNTVKMHTRSTRQTWGGMDALASNCLQKTEDIGQTQSLFFMTRNFTNCKHTCKQSSVFYLTDID